MILAAGVAAAWLLAGCATTQGYEDFSATWPEELPRDAPASGSIYQAGYDVPLFENVVAHRVGDTVTIILSEQTAAQKSSSTSTSNTSSPRTTRSESPTRTEREGFGLCPPTSTLPVSTACRASVRVLKKRAAHSQTSMRTLSNRPASPDCAAMCGF